MPTPRRPLTGRAGPAVWLAVATFAAVVAAPAAAGDAAAQVTPPPGPADRAAVTVVPGARYEAGWLRRLIDGDNHRDLWLRPLRVRVLDLDRYGGGLEPDHAGGNQSRTLHLTAPDGRTYIFRSTDKFVGQVLPEDLRETWTEDIMQDHVSVFHPTAGLVVPALHDALGLLAVPGELRVMPDDPRLGEFRETFAGMLGLVVERPNEGENDRPLYGGFEKIVGEDEILDKLEDHPQNRVAEREYLAARLIDVLVGDTDRGPDQWRWAREPHADGFRWRPIARDRDWAFVHADGLAARLARGVFPKLVRFEDRIPGIEALTFADRGLGRRMLTELDREAWREVVREVVSALDDAVIDDAVALLPPEHRDHGPALAATLRARREQLPRVADAFYERLATDVDVRATDQPDRAEIVRAADGTVRVTLLARAGTLRPVVAEAGDDGEDGEDGETAGVRESGRTAPGIGGGRKGEDAGAGWAPYYERTFHPSETREVRVFLHGGDDVAVVRGRGPGEITVRVIGGGDDDALYDEGEPSARTAFYDDAGDNLLSPGPRTRVDERPYDDPEPGAGGFFAYQLSRQRDWGSERSWFNPALDYREAAGLIVGGGPTWTDYGFRRRPYAYTLSLKGLYGTRSQTFAVDAAGELRRENSPVGFRVHARASQFEGVRFYGFGNDTPDLAAEDALIVQDRLLVEPSVRVWSDRWSGGVGPVLRWTDPAVPAANPARSGGPEAGPVPGAEATTELGGRAELTFRAVDHENVPTKGIRASVELSGFPAAGDAGSHAGAGAELRGYLPVPLPTGTVLALRAGGRTVWGDAPLHDLAWLGGRTTLRGYRWQRYAGDAAVYGGAELRVPLFRAHLGIARGRLGAIGFADAGRVYVDGRSPGGFHTGWGGGLSFATLDTAVHLLWARGAQDRLYAGLGVPF